MSDDLNSTPLAEPAEVATPAPRVAPTRSPRKKRSAAAPVDAVATAEPPPAETPDAAAAKPKPRRAPRKPKGKLAESTPDAVMADLFAAPESPTGADHAGSLVEAEAPIAPAMQTVADAVPMAAFAPLAAGEGPDEAPAEPDDGVSDSQSEALADGEAPAAPRRKRKRRRGKGGAERESSGEQIEMPGLADALAEEPATAPAAETLSEDRPGGRRSPCRRA